MSEHPGEQRFARKAEGYKLRTFARSYGFRHANHNRYENGSLDKREDYRIVLAVREQLEQTGWAEPDDELEPVPGRKRNKIPQAIQLPYRKKKFWSRNQPHYFKHNFGPEYTIAVKGLQDSFRPGVSCHSSDYHIRGALTNLTSLGFLPDPAPQHRYRGNLEDMVPDGGNAGWAQTGLGDRT